MQKIEDIIYGCMIDVVFDVVGIKLMLCVCVDFFDVDGKVVLVGLFVQDIDVGLFFNFNL